MPNISSVEERLRRISDNLALIALHEHAVAAAGDMCFLGTDVFNGAHRAVALIAEQSFDDVELVCRALDADAMNTKAA